MAKAYRDDLEAAHARINQLERELTEAREDKQARDRIAQLERELAEARGENRRVEPEDVAGASKEPSWRNDDPFEASERQQRRRQQRAERNESSLFQKTSSGSVLPTRVGVRVYWAIVGACLALCLALCLSLFPLSPAGALFQAVLSPLLGLPVAAFAVAPAVMGRMFEGKTWKRLSPKARVAMIIVGLAALVGLMLASYALGAALNWKGGEI